MSVWKIQRGQYKGTWAFKFQHNKKQHIRRGFTTKSQANREEQTLRNQLEYQKTNTAFSVMCNKYLSFCEGRFDKNTIQQKIFAYRLLVNHIGYDFYAHELTAQTIVDCLAVRQSQSGNKAANRTLKEIKALYNWLIKYKYVDENPCNDIQPYPEEKVVPYIPPYEDFQRVLLAAKPDDQDFLTILYHTAARRGEILERLKWDDINFEERWLRLWTRKRKGGNLESRFIPLNKTLIHILKKRWKKRSKFSPYVFRSPKTGGQYSKEAKKHIMKTLCKRAGVKHFTLKALRHLSASVLNDSHKASSRQIQRYLGHKRLDTTERYLHDLRPMDDISYILDEPPKPSEKAVHPVQKSRSNLSQN